MLRQTLGVDAVFLVVSAILLLGAKHWLFQVDAEDMERLESKVDSIAERLGLDPDESDEPQPERHKSGTE